MWLGKLFKKKKKSYNTDGQYKLLIIDENAELLHQNLGISEERIQEIVASCVAAYDSSQTMHSALEKIVNSCKHINEVAMASIVLQKVVDKNHSSDRLHNMIKNLFGHG